MSMSPSLRSDVPSVCWVVRLLVVATLVLFCCYLVSHFCGFDFHFLFSQIKSLLLRKGLFFILERVGRQVGLLLAIIGVSLFDVESLVISNPSGASGSSCSGNWQQYIGLSSDMDQNPQQPTGDGDREVTSSSSGNWRQYLDLSSDKEGDSTHEPSTLSSWGGSWIERWFSSGISSSAPNQGPPAVDQNQGGHEATSPPAVDQNQGGHEATNPPTEVMGPEAPSPDHLKSHIQTIFLNIKGRNPHSRILNELFEDLRLESASTEKRLKILQILGEMDENSDSLKNEKLHIHLAVSVYDWERDVP